jgi:hypothetical protein
LSTQTCGNALDEWKEARSVLARFDNNLHDLRKYGFSFVTALLAANGLISIGGTAEVTAEVKAAILIVTMGLIVALKLLDRHYLCFENAATLRCRILEDRLNIDLTGDIAFFYKTEQWWINVLGLYIGFIALTGMLGVAIFWNQFTSALVWIVLSVAVIASCSIAYIDLRKTKNTDLQDWSVDLKIISQGTPLRITYTNLNPNNHEKPGAFSVWWTVKSLQEKEEQTQGPAVEVVQLKTFENHIWIWETTHVKPGLYEFNMFAEKEPTEQSKLTTDSQKSGRKWIIQVTEKRPAT